MEIRKAKPEEAGKITRELWLPLAREMEEVSEYSELAEDLDLKSSAEHKRERIESEDSYVFVAVKEGVFVGFISATVKDSNPVFSRGKKMKVDELFVKEEFRRKGTASKLFQKIEETAGENGCETVELDVNVENKAAKEFYQKHGLEAERERMVKKL